MELAPASPAAVDEAALWETHSPRLFRYLMRLTGDQQVAEDLTQDAFLQAIRHLRGSRELPQNETAWLLTIATNLFRDQVRRKRRIAWLPFVTQKHEQAVPDRSEGLAEQELVGRVLRSLPAETSVMLVLRDAEGFSTQEVAGLMGLQYEAARKRIARARLQFRERYEAMGGTQS